MEVICIIRWSVIRKILYSQAVTLWIYPTAKVSKGRFSKKWGLRANVSFCRLHSPPRCFRQCCARPNFCAAKKRKITYGNACYAGYVLLCTLPVPLPNPSYSVPLIVLRVGVRGGRKAFGIIIKRFIRSDGSDIVWKVILQQYSAPLGRNGVLKTTTGLGQRNLFSLSLSP